MPSRGAASRRWARSRGSRLSSHLSSPNAMPLVGRLLHVQVLGGSGGCVAHTPHAHAACPCPPAFTGVYDRLQHGSGPSRLVALVATFLGSALWHGLQAGFLLAAAGFGGCTAEPPRGLRLRDQGPPSCCLGGHLDSRPCPTCWHESTRRESCCCPGLGRDPRRDAHVAACSRSAPPLPPAAPQAPRCLPPGSCTSGSRPAARGRRCSWAGRRRTSATSG